MAPINAKTEFIDHVNWRFGCFIGNEFADNARCSIRCAHISYGDKEFKLRENYTQKMLETFLESLDFTYNSYVKSLNRDPPRLQGTIWYMSHYPEWSERVEYNGHDSWEFRQEPLIPLFLLDLPPK